MGFSKKSMYSLVVTILVVLAVAFTVMLIPSLRSYFTAQDQMVSTNCSLEEVDIAGFKYVIRVDGKCDLVEALKIAKSGTLIEIYGSRVYRVSELVIDKSGIAIRSMSGRVILDGYLNNTQKSVWILEIRASNVSIYGLEVRGGLYGIKVIDSENITLQDIVFRGCYYGISIEFSKKVLLASNNFTRNSIAIKLYNSTNVVIANSVFADNSKDIAIDYSRYVEIRLNKFYGSQNALLIMRSRKVIVTGNAVNSTGYGLNIVSSSEISVYANRFIGTFIKIRRPDTYNVTLYYNSFVDSSIETSSSAEVKWYIMTKYWYRGKWFSGGFGNYWSNYSGSDVDGDGIGDKPYECGGVRDPYPLIRDIDWYILPSVEKA